MTVSPTDGSTFPRLLEAALRTDPARPLVTFYDDATGERIELSVTTYANWVAKTAALLQDELDVERGATVLVSLPTHWLGAVWLGAAWSVGACITDDPARADDADVLVGGPDQLDVLAGQAHRAPVLALSLRPLGGRFTDPLPPGVTDYGAVVLGQPDVFVPYDPAGPADLAWQDATGSLAQADVAALGLDGARGADEPVHDLQRLEPGCRARTAEVSATALEAGHPCVQHRLRLVPLDQRACQRQDLAWTPPILAQADVTAEREIVDEIPEQLRIGARHHGARAIALPPAEARFAAEAPEPA